MTGLTFEENVIYPISGSFVAITLRFSANTDVATVLFADDTKTRYEVQVDLANPVTFTLTNADSSELPPVTVSHSVATDVDISFWVDFSSDEFVVGMGSAELTSASHIAPSISRLVIAPDPATVVTASVCSQRGRFSSRVFAVN